ncbi:MAG: hypothetical protein PHP75_09805, partial [Methylacidiphilaceae bacterium]|nr:hypothetical protein [Candidatus Methylacidiphilaceae bacterium]
MVLRLASLAICFASGANFNEKCRRITAAAGERPIASKINDTERVRGVRVVASKIDDTLIGDVFCFSKGSLGTQG